MTAIEGYTKDPVRYKGCWNCSKSEYYEDGRVYCTLYKTNVTKQGMCPEYNDWLLIKDIERKE